MRGLITAMVASAALCAGSAPADELFMHRFNVGGVNDLLVYDTSAGTESIVGSTGIGEAMGFSFAPVDVPKADGGFWPAGTLFGLERNGGLYVIDTSDASTTLIGVHALSQAESLTFGLDGTLYTNDGINLYELSTEDASLTLIGTIDAFADGLSVFPEDTSIDGFGVADAGDLIAVDSGNLYHIDIDTLATVQIATGEANETIAFAPNGTLYSHDFGGELYETQLDPFMDVFIDNTSGSIEAMAARLGEQECVADCNGDGELSILDFICFQGEWEDGTPYGDCDGNNQHNILDFVCYQGLFDDGCP